VGNVFSGWTIPTDAADREASSECVVIFMWESLDEMHDVKNDQESLFNNGFKPLRDESEGSKTVL